MARTVAQLLKVCLPYLIPLAIDVIKNWSRIKRRRGGAVSRAGNLPRILKKFLDNPMCCLKI